MASAHGWWINSTGWLDPSVPHCDWFGITCTKGRVTQINLSGNGLSGEVSPFISQLEKLEVLDLSSNLIEGMIGPEISLLNNLVVLDLSSNQLSMFEMGTVFEKLEVLDLSNNLMLMVEDYFGERLMNLRELNLSKNCLMELPANIKMMQKLEVLDLSNGNLFMDMLPVELWTELKALKKLILTFAEVSLIPTGVSGLVSLEVLELGLNMVMMLPEDFDGLKSLQVLNLEYNMLEEFPILKDMNSLKELKVKGNMMEALDVSLLNSENLEVLTVWCEMLVPNSFKESQLKTLELTHFSEMPEGGGMHMRSSSDDEMMMFSFPELPSTIESITIEVNGMVPNWTQPDSQEFSDLKTFSLVSVDETIEFPFWIVETAPSVESVKIHNFFGPIPSQLHLLEDLKELTLTEGKLKSTLPSELGMLSHLESLIIGQYLDLTGSLPSELSKLASLHTLVLNETNLSGEMPPSLDLASIQECQLGEREKVQLTGMCREDQILLREDMCGINCPEESIDGSWVIEPSSSQTVQTQYEISQYLNISFDNFEIQSSEPQYFFKVSGKIGNVTQLQRFSKESQASASSSPFQVVFYFEKKSFAFQKSGLSRGFNHICQVTNFTDQGEVDISHLNCNVSDTLQFRSIESCPFIEAIIDVDFTAQTLKIPLDTLLYTPCSSTSASVSRTESTMYQYQMTEFNKGWECDVLVRSSIQCSTVCGDGIVTFDEECDYASPPEETLCSQKCLLTPDSETESSNNHTAAKIAIPVIIGIFLILLIGGVILFRKFRNDNSLLILESELEAVEVIGEGHFGTVFKGLWRGTTEVAIKQLKLHTANDEQFKDFQKEAQLLTSLPPHPNIVQFLGLCVSSSHAEDRIEKQTTEQDLSLSVTQNVRRSTAQDIRRSVAQDPRQEMTPSVPQNVRRSTARPKSWGGDVYDAVRKETKSGILRHVQIVTEFLPEGNLVSFLRRRFKENDEKDPDRLREDFLMIVELAEGIAAGMDHLHSNKIVHRDLAARNILILTTSHSKQNANAKEGIRLKVIPKITDFGLSTKSKEVRMIPVRWSAPEVLIDSTNYWKSSDVWSFGILLFELSVYCTVLPYRDLPTNRQVRDYVLGGGQVKIENGLFGTSTEDQSASRFVSLMRSCFAMSGMLRPSFALLFQGLKDERERIFGDLSETKDLKSRMSEDESSWDDENPDVIYVQMNPASRGPKIDLPYE